MATVVFALAATPVAAGNRTLPKEGNSYLTYKGGVDFVPQVDGTGIYYQYVTPRTRKSNSRRHSIIRFDVGTGKSRTVLDWGKRSIYDFRVSGGQLTAAVELTADTRGVMRVPLDGSARVLLVKARWRSVPGWEKGTRETCGTALFPSSISANGDVVVSADAVDCKTFWGRRKYLIFRADGTRQEVNDETVIGEYSEYAGYPFHTQLAGNRLLVSDQGARIYDLATGATTTAWGYGLDHAVFADDGSLWFSAIGESVGFWSVLLRGTAPYDAPVTVTTGTGSDETTAARFLPLTCGPNILVVRAITTDYDGSYGGGDGIFSQLDNMLRFGGLVSFDLFSPDGSLLRSLPQVKMAQVAAAGCDASGATLVGVGIHNKFEYARVAF